MKTPKEFKESVKNRTLTREMLLLCIFSLEMRARNWIDRIERNRFEDILWRYRHSGVSGFIVYCNLVDRVWDYREIKHTLIDLIPPEEITPEMEDYDGKTIGVPLKSLISVQFCRKVERLILSRDYSLISPAPELERNEAEEQEIS